MTVTILIALTLGASQLALAPPVPAPPVPAAPVAAPTERLEQLPFACETLSLSEALREAAQNNPELDSVQLDVEIAEAAVLEALGAFDLTLTASTFFAVEETPQRGSQVTFQRGTRSRGLSVGLERKLETGGTVSLSLQTQRARLQQPVDLTNPDAGSQSISAYAVTPTLELSHPLLRGMGLKVNRAQVRKAKIATTTAEAQRLAAAQDLARAVVVAYWRVLYAHRDWTNRRHSLETVQRQLTRTQVLVRRGRKSSLDRKAVEQAVAVREASLYRAETAVLDSSLELRALMGQRPSAARQLGVLPSTDPEVRAREVNVEAEVERALATHPTLRSAELQIASRQLDEKVAANNRLPSLDAGISFTPQGRAIETVANPAVGSPGSQASWGEAFGNILDPGDGGLADWSVQGQVSLRWDVRNRQAKGAMQQAELRRRQAESSLESKRQELEVQVIRAANRVRTASKVMRASELSHELALENLGAEEIKLTAGRATAYDVLLRLDDADEAATEALRARTDYLEALVELQSLNGEILPAYGLVA